MIYVNPTHALTVAITSGITRPATVTGYLATLHALYSGAILPAATRR